MVFVRVTKFFLPLWAIAYLLYQLIDFKVCSSKLKIVSKFHCRFRRCGFYTCLLLLINTNYFIVDVVHADEFDKYFNAATVDFVKGYAAIYPDNDSASAIYAKRGVKIIEKDYIITGDNGFISFSFSSGTVVNVQPSSKISMEKIECKKNSSQCQLVLKTHKGSLSTNVESQPGHDNQFTIKTPYASAAVRGTIFDIDVNSTRLLTGVTEGQVRVKSESGAVELPENFGTRVQENQPPSAPKPLLSAPTILQGPVRYDSEGTLAWGDVAMANKYLISLSNTSGPIYSKQSTNTRHRLQALKAGTYAARIRAIDDDGFKGRIAEHEINVVETDDSRPGPILTTMVDVADYSVVVKPQNTATNLIELHFSATKDFEKPVNLDVATGEPVFSNRADNSIYVRGRGILSKTTVTPFGPTIEVPGKN